MFYFVFSIKIENHLHNDKFYINSHVSMFCISRILPQNAYGQFIKKYVNSQVSMFCTSLIIPQNASNQFINKICSDVRNCKYLGVLANDS